MVAALDDPNRPQGILAASTSGRADLTIAHKTGETWLLVNEGPDTAHIVAVEGLTDLDKRRLSEIAPEPSSLGAGQAKEFVLASRYTLTGPANVVISYRLESGGPQLRRILQVPAE